MLLAAVIGISDRILKHHDGHTVQDLLCLSPFAYSGLDRLRRRDIYPADWSSICLALSVIEMDMNRHLRISRDPCRVAVFASE